MENPGKLRQDHRGQPVPHFGHDHFEKSQLEKAASTDTGAMASDAQKARDTIEGEHQQPELLGALGSGGGVHIEPQANLAEEDLDGEDVPRAPAESPFGQR
jgi:hypothetical protein